MGKLYFEKKTVDDGCRKIYFTSYLRKDFVERSLVVTLRMDYSIKNIYFSSYNYGSVEWINGGGLTDSRLWENDEQAVSPTYLTRRYTVRMANGPATGDFARDSIIPDVLDNLADRNFAGLITRIISRKSSSRKLMVDEMEFIQPV